MPNRAAGYPQEIRGKGNNEQRRNVKVAKERLNAAKSYRQRERELIWDQSEQQYEGHHWTQTDDGQDQIVVNYSFGNVNVIVPYMTGSEPNFLVRPYGDGANSFNAALQQAFINRIWRSQDVAGQEELESSAVDFVIYGDGYLKVGYSIEEQRVESEARTYADVAKLWVARTDPWDVWVDPTATGIHNARWVCHRFRMTREELEASGFSNVNDDNVNFGEYHRIGVNESAGASQRRLGMRESLGGLGEYAVLYEYFDLVGQRRVVFADGESPLAFDEDVPACPIVQMGNYLIPGSPYHMGELEQIWGIQQELNKTRSQMIAHRARNVQKFGAKKGVLDPAAKQALRSGVVNEVVEVDSDLPLNELVQPFSVMPLQADVYNISDVMIHDLYEISGVTELMRGAAPNIRKSATEITVMEGAANVKAQQKLRQVERAARKVGELLLAFAADVFPQTDYDEVQLFLTGKDAESIAEQAPDDMLVDENGPIPLNELAGVTLRPRPDMWVGTYEVFVEQASTELRNPIVREQKYRGIVMDLISIQPALMEQGKMLDLQKLVSIWLEAAGVEDVDRLFVPLPPPALDPGRLDVELQGGANNELLGALLAGDVGNLPPDQVPPDMSMGAFDEGNTGIMEPMV